MSIRHHLDIPYLIGQFLQGRPNKEAITRERARLNAIGRGDLADRVTKNVIIGIKRDLKEGKIPLHNPSDTSTFIYGVEDDNGGIPVYTGEMDIVAESVLILNDIHFPFVDPDMLQRVVAELEQNEYEYTILAGDVLNGSAHSHWNDLVEMPSFRQEAKIAKAGLKRVLELSNRVIYFRGNHEDWHLKNNNGTVDFRDFARLIVEPKFNDKVVISPYDRMFITSNDERFLLAHQKEVSSANKLVVAEKLAWKYLCHVVITHQHKNAISTDKYNNFVIASLGGLHDPRKSAYVQLKTTTAPEQEQGFGVIRNGNLKIWTPNKIMTDW